ncbi:MAG TPA: SUMF1/EgtB/PvdO family nonheme iron enzyme [Blastocatellia bacterium]|nr:SUMF1/EgtB/PvdO family nonheme iron enzyme [Blastocatellia bacterium]
MTPERWQQVKPILQSALDLAPGQRASFLDSACDGDTLLRKEVESLLASHREAGSLLDSPAFEAAADLLADETVDLAGRKIGHYKVVSQIGRGGMGVVYLAEDKRLGRKVALKILPSYFTRDPQRVRRFEQEARAASALNHPNILMIFDIGQVETVPFIATEFIEGETLRSRLTRGGLGVDEALDLSIQAASALVAAHSAGIAHRDIKPENIMLRPDGYVKVLDFGLAKLTEQRARPSNTTAPTLGQIDTAPGTVVGTANYLAPEQARGLDVDARADLFSLGVVIYEMVAGHPPFRGETTSDVIAAILKEEPPALSQEASNVPAELQQIVSKALRKDKEERYQSAKQMLDDLTVLRKEREVEERIKSRSSGETAQAIPHSGESATRLIETKRKRIVSGKNAVAIAAAVIIGAAAVYFYWRSSNVKWAREQLPRIEEMAERGDYFQAYDLAVKARKYLPDDPTIVRLMPAIADDLSIATEPAGASVYIKRFIPDEAGGFPARELIGTTPITHLQIARGAYVVYVEKDGYAATAQTVSGMPPRYGGRIAFMPPPISIKAKLVESDRVPKRMAYVPGGDYRLVSWDRPTEVRVRLDPYFIDRFEVSNQEYKEFINAGGYLKKQFWKHPFVKDGKPLSWEEATKEFKDRTGLPGPRSWSNQNFPEGKADHPVTDICWYEAAAYAEFRGKRLPTIFQWEKAARDGRVSFTGPVMPWGTLTEPTTHRANFKTDGTAPVSSFEFGMSPYGAFNMAGNVSEWCLNETMDGHVASGGSWDDLYYSFGYHGRFPSLYSSTKLGFRCAVNAEGAATDQGAWPIVPERAIPRYEPVSEATYKKLLAYFDYPKADLHAEVVEVKETDEWRLEKIAFDSTAGDRAIAYLYLPKNYPAPFQVIHCVPPGGIEARAYTLSQFIERELRPFIKSGRAVLGVAIKGYQERPWPADYTPPSINRVEFRDVIVTEITDLRRGLDYLMTRPDMDASRINYMSMSPGGFKLILPAIEPRYRSVFWTGASIEPDARQYIPEANPINFVSRIRAPKLMMHGKYDEVDAFRTESEPLFKLFGEPKQFMPYDGGHIPDRELFVPTFNQWLDKTLGPVKTY